MQIDANLIGYCAAVLTTGAFVPQTIKTIRSRDTRAISLWMYAAFVAGIAFWFVYG
jgi:MtN3 and saliva related transmembrane protein